MPVVDINGISLSYDLHDGSDPLVLVCGTGQQAASWTAAGTVTDAVSDGFQVITFDNRGMPPTDCPAGPYSVELMAADTIGLIEHLGLRNVAVVGVSLGGFIAFEVARSRPDLTRAAVCIAGVVGGSKYAQLLAEAWVETLAQGAAIPTALDVLLGLPVSLPVSVLQDDAIVEAMVGFMATALPEWSGPGRLGQLQASLDWTHRPRDWQEKALGETSPPVLVVAHELDVLSPPALLRWAAELLPAGKYVEIAGCAHAAAADPQAHRQAINDFLTSVQSPT